MVLQKESLSSANMLLVEARWSLPGFFSRALDNSRVSHVLSMV